MTARLSALIYMTLDADTMDPIETRATSRLQTAFRRGDVWVASGGGADFVVVNAKTGVAVPRPRIETKETAS